MKKTKRKKIIYLNSVMFLIGWVIIFLLGADFPPPIGFMGVVLLIIILDYIQYLYLKKYFLESIMHQKPIKSFLMNLLFYFIGGFLLSSFLSLFQLKIVGIENALIWVFVVTLAGSGYGICFWIWNKILVRFIK